MSDVRVAVFLADGFEEIEALTPVDFLRRAGAEVLICGVGSSSPQGARGVSVNTDLLISEISGKLDAVILPGGMPGASNLGASPEVDNLCRTAMDDGALLAAICAAPVEALAKFGLLKNRRFTCYPGFEEKVREGEFVSDRVVQDGNLITSRGPGTAGEFSIELIRYLFGDENADNIAAETMLFR